MKIADFFRTSSTLAKILQLTGFSLVFGVLFLSIPSILFGQDLTDATTIKGYQLFQMLGVFLIPALLLSSLWNEDPFESLRLYQKPSPYLVILTVLLMILSIPAINMIGEFNEGIHLPSSLSWLEASIRNTEKQAEIVTRKILMAEDFSIVLLNLGLIAVLPALSEEIYFRGIIQNFFKKWGIHWSIWIAAIVFSAVHMQFLGFIPRMLFGAVFGYLFVWTGNLWYPIIAHFVNNSMAVLFFSPDGEKDYILDLNKIGTSNDLPWLGWISVVVVIGVMYLIYDKTRKN